MLNSRRRRWLVALGLAMLIAGAVVVGIVHLRGRPAGSDCQTVRAMLDYNGSQLQSFQSSWSTSEADGPDLNAYQDWAAGMQRYAAQVQAPDLAAHAHRVADLADRMVDIIRDAQDDPPDLDSTARPPWVSAYMQVTKESKGEFEALNDACPADR